MGLDSDHNVTPNKRTIQPKSPLRVEKLIRVTTPEGWTVLDLFAGSGTTLVAVMNLGMECIGIEKDERYIEVMEQSVGGKIPSKPLRPCNKIGCKELTKIDTASRNNQQKSNDWNNNERQLRIEDTEGKSVPHTFVIIP